MDDARYRTKVFIDTYNDVEVYPAMGHIYKDDGATECTYNVMYAKPNIHIKYLYGTPKNWDILYTIGEPDNIPRLDWQHQTYGYQEQVPIALCAVNKDGVTAQLVLWQAETKLRKIVETYFSGYLRILRRTKPSQQYLGGFFEYTVECVISYIRSTDTVPTVPSITWGPHASPTGTFVIPNMVTFEMTPTSNNIHGSIPGRKCDKTQKLGLPDYQIRTSHDLDIEPDTLSWKRAQTGSATDIIKGQVFLDIYYGSQAGEEYQTLNLGWGTTIKVTLEEPHFYMEGDRHMLDLTMYSYNTTEPATYKALFGISP